MAERTVRILVGKPWLDGHDRGAKNIARSPERMEKFLTTSNIELERCFTPGFDYPGYEE